MENIWLNRGGLKDLKVEENMVYKLFGGGANRRVYRSFGNGGLILVLFLDFTVVFNVFSFRVFRALNGTVESVIFEVYFIFRRSL